VGEGGENRTKRRRVWVSAIRLSRCSGRQNSAVLTENIAEQGRTSSWKVTGPCGGHSKGGESERKRPFRKKVGNKEQMAMVIVRLETRTGIRVKGVRKGMTDRPIPGIHVV